MIHIVQAIQRFSWLVPCFALMLGVRADASVTATILAGGETDLPSDTPSGRLDAEGTFPFVGALAISSGASNYKGSAVAISREWVLTAGHNADLNDDGRPDAAWSGAFHLPGDGGFQRIGSVHPSQFQRVCQSGGE